MSLAEFLATAPLLRGLSDAQRDRVAAMAHERTFTPGQRLFHEGRPAVGCWLVRSGHVAIDTAVPGRGSVVLQTIGPGDLVGWSWLLPPYRWHFGAVAVDTVAAVELDTDALRGAAEEDPALGYRFALVLVQTLAHRLQGTRARMLDLYRSPRER